jgi:hypothetical protein
MTMQKNLNHLRRGATYCATTPRGSSTGEYLGIETPHGEWAILIRTDGETTSIPMTDITEVTAA